MKLTAAAEAASLATDGTAGDFTAAEVVATQIADELVKVAAKPQSCEEISTILQLVKGTKKQKKKKKKKQTTASQYGDDYLGVALAEVGSVQIAEALVDDAAAPLSCEEVAADLNPKRVSLDERRRIRRIGRR